MNARVPFGDGTGDRPDYRRLFRPFGYMLGEFSRHSSLKKCLRRGEAGALWVALGKREVREAS